MPSGFRLLVYAIVTLLVIALVYQLMGPLLNPPADNLTMIENSLKASETGLGKSFSSETYFQAGEGFSEQTFNRRTRNTSFQCINPALCCPQTEECSLSIVWDNNQLKFNEPRTVVVTTRCDLLDLMYACDIYIGEKPGQIEIDQVSGPKELDLGREEMHFDLVYSNPGNQKIEQSDASIKIFQMYFEDEKWEERLVEHASKTVELGKLLPDETRTKRIGINLNQNGPFRAEITVRGLNAGFDKESFQFETDGAVSDCLPRNCESPVFAGGAQGQCTTRCFCQDCLLGSRCAELLQEADSVVLGLPPSITVKGGTPDIVGSNIVDMLLEKGMCPSDIVIEEPNAVAGIIGFKVKNVGDNPVQKSFEVKAYIYGSEQKIGSVTVSPEEINGTGDVIKSIEVSLLVGRHSVRLVANSEPETELEADYENNDALVEVEIPVPLDVDTDPLLNPPELGLCCGLPMQIVNRETRDLTGAIYIKEAVEGINPKVRADFDGRGFRVYFKIQNMTKENLKISIPFGQIFVPQNNPGMQNLGKGKDNSLGRPLNQLETLVIEIPVCTVYVSSFKAYCLNRKKRLPKSLLDLGEIITNLDVLEAMRLGSQAAGLNAKQSAVWNAIEINIDSPSTFGSGGTLIRPLPTNLALGVDLTPLECIAAGLRPANLICKPSHVSDPSDTTVEDFFCNNP